MEPFGTLADGRETQLHTLSNANGMSATVTDFGATLVSLTAPDRSGRFADLTHGFASVAGYTHAQNPYFGASVGRFGNRIAAGRFRLNGTHHQLATNNDPGGIPCHLHGGNLGFHQRLWTVERAADHSIILGYLSPDGEEGYPGNLRVRVTYTLTDHNELIWEATATTDAPTIVNLVHHSYWNLSGDPSRSIHDHLLTLHADHFLPTNAGLIPTGERAPVAGTPMDFTRPTAIGERIEADFEPLHLANGYDHCWILRKPTPDQLVLAATLSDLHSGRTMELLTNQPAIQFYAGNFLDGRVTGKHGGTYPRRSALCLETENFPDSPNQPDFPSPILLPGETYRHHLVHRFATA